MKHRFAKSFLTIRYFQVQPITVEPRLSQGHADGFSSLKEA